MSHRSAHHHAGASMETGNTLGNNRSVVRQSRKFRENESGNAMKSLLGSDHLAWDTVNKQGVFAGQRAYADSGRGGGAEERGLRDGGSSPAPTAPPAAPPAPPAGLPVCPYVVGDAVIYEDRARGTTQLVTVAAVSTNVPVGEEPMIAVKMPDGNVRDTVLARLSPAPAGVVPAPADGEQRLVCLLCATALIPAGG